MNITILRKTLRNIDRGISDLVFYDFVFLHNYSIYNKRKYSKQNLSRLTKGERSIWANEDLMVESQTIEVAKSIFLDSVLNILSVPTKNLWVFYLKQIIINDREILSFQDTSKEYFLNITEDDKFLETMFEWIINHDYLNLKGNWNELMRNYISEVTSTDYFKKILLQYQSNKDKDENINLLSRKETNKKFSLPILAKNKNVKTINVLALSCYYFVTDSTGRSKFQEALDNNINFRIIIANPNNEFCRKQAIDFIKGPIPNAESNSENSSKSFISIIEKLTKNGKPNQVQIRYFNHSMPFSIFISHYKNDKAVCKIDLYSLNTDDDERRSFICNEDTETFKFYKEQFNYVWKNSIPIIQGE